MKFSQVAEAFEAGKKISRGAWLKGSFIRFENERILDEDDDAYQLDDCDFICRDWRVFDEPSACTAPYGKEQYLIVRTRSAGVFAGYFESKDGQEVSLTNARRIWQWHGAASLSQLAMEGTSEPAKCKFPAPVEKVLLLETIEILNTTNRAKISIESVPVWKQ